MAKQTGPEKKKKKRTEPHMVVRDLPNGLREVTVDGHTWIEGPYTPEPRDLADDEDTAADPDEG
jgi:hypothetical protein